VIKLADPAIFRAKMVIHSKIRLNLFQFISLMTLILLAFRLKCADTDVWHFLLDSLGSASIKVKDEKSGSVYTVGAHDLSSASTMLIGRILTFFFFIIAMLST